MRAAVNGNGRRGGDAGYAVSTDAGCSVSTAVFLHVVVLLLSAALVAGCSTAAGSEAGGGAPSGNAKAGADGRPAGDGAAARSAAGREAVRLARRGGELDANGLRRLGGLLERNVEVRGFPAEFATALGTRGTLRLWAAFRSADGHGASVQRLRVSLGQTLAAATRTDSPAVDAWRRGLIAAGDRRRGGGPGSGSGPGPGPGPGRPYGFQIVAELMDVGEWDARFLDAYGRRLLAFERAAVADGRTPKALWTSGSDGRDPVGGLLRAASHSPDAATRLLNRPSAATYLLRDREHFDTGADQESRDARESRDAQQSRDAQDGQNDAPDGGDGGDGGDTRAGQDAQGARPARDARDTRLALGAALFAAGSGRTPEDRTSEYAEPTRAQLAATRTVLRLLTGDDDRADETGADAATDAAAETAGHPSFPPELCAGVGRLLAHHGRRTYETMTEPSPARVPFDRALVARTITEVARDGAALGLLDRTLNEVAVYDFRVEKAKRQRGGGSAFRAGRVNGFLRFAAGAAFAGGGEKAARTVGGAWGDAAAEAVAGGGLGYVPVPGGAAHPVVSADELVRALAEGYRSGAADEAFSASRMPVQALTTSWLAVNRDRLSEYQGSGIPEFDGYTLTQWFGVGFADGEEAARQAGVRHADARRPAVRQPDGGRPVTRHQDEERPDESPSGDGRPD